MARLARMTVIVFGLFLMPGVVASHPGGTDDEGCHTCGTDCAKWGLEDGEEHCHGGGSEDETATKKQRADRAGDDDGEDGETPTIEEGQRAYVDKVVDGDTLEVRLVDGDGTRVKVRMLGIDCPESHKNSKCRRQGRNGGPTCAEQIPRGLKAAKYAAKLVKQKVVRLESGEEDGEFKRGGYGRVLAYIRMKDGRDLAKVLIEKGMCRNYGYKYPHPRNEAYDEAEESAKKAKKSEEPSGGCR